MSFPIARKKFIFCINPLYLSNWKVKPNHANPHEHKAKLKDTSTSKEPKARKYRALKQRKGGQIKFCPPCMVVKN